MTGEENRHENGHSVSDPIDTADSSGESRATAAPEDGQKEKLPEGSTQTGQPAALVDTGSFDWRGWLLVGIVFVSFLLVPAFVLYLPEAHWLISRFGFTQRQAFILFPMIPAIILGCTAVWATMRAQSRTDD